MRSSEFRRDVVAYLTTLETNPNHIHPVEDILSFPRTILSEDDIEHGSTTLKKILWTRAEGIDGHSIKCERMANESFDLAVFVNFESQICFPKLGT